VGLVVVVVTSATAWTSRFMVVLAAVESLFVRPEPRRTVGAYLLGLLSAVEHKNCWWLAEHAGDARLDAMQRLLTSAGCSRPTPPDGAGR